MFVAGFGAPVDHRGVSSTAEVTVVGAGCGVVARLRPRGLSRAVLRKRSPLSAG